MARLSAFAAVLLAGASVAHAQDLTGIWKITRPIVELKTDTGSMPPLKPAALALYRARIAEHAKGDLSYDPTQVCKPIGEPRVMYEGQPFEIVQTPGTLIFIYQWNRLDHILYADTTKPGPLETYFGTGPFHWDGHTLELDLSMFHSNTLLDAAGMPHSEALKLTERYSLGPDHNTLNETIRFDDPKTFTRPWTATFHYTRQNMVRLPEDVCEERMHMFPQK